MKTKQIEKTIIGVNVANIMILKGKKIPQNNIEEMERRS